MGWRKLARNAVEEAEAVTSPSAEEEAHQVPASLWVTRRQAMTPACDAAAKEEAVEKVVVSVPGKEVVEDQAKDRSGLKLIH